MKNINLGNKNKIIMTIISVIMITIIGVTLAWYVWSSTNTINVSLGTCTPEISFEGGNTINGDGLIPVLSKEEGAIKEINVTKSKSCKSNETVKMNLYMKLDSLPLELQHETFIYEIYKDDTKISNGNFSGKTQGSTLTIITNENVTSETITYTVYIYIDGTQDNPVSMAGKSFAFSLWGEGTGAIYKSKVAATIISNLYKPDGNTTPTVNSITYNLDTTNRLMEDIDGNIRYYGSDDPNIVDDLKNYIYFNCTEYPSTNCEVWRIIGVFGDKIKIMRNSPLDIDLSWDTSASTVNEGYGINEWSQADLMKLLNPGYTNNQDLNNSGNTITVNNSLYWTGAQAISSGTCYNNSKNRTTTCDFRSTGLKNDKTRDLISEHTWSLRGFSSNSTYVAAAYNQEISTGTVIQNPSDGITRTTSWPGKIALAYASDYGYAADLSQCQRQLSGYFDTTCTSNNWMFNGSNQWFLTPLSSYANRACYVYYDGNLYSSNACYAYSVRPVLYLNSDVSLGGGTGASNDPYTLAVN